MNDGQQDHEPELVIGLPEQAIAAFSAHQQLADHIKKAEEFMNAKRYLEAVSLFEEIPKKFPKPLADVAKGLLNGELALLYFWLGDYGTARRHADQALQTTDNPDRAYEVLGKIALAEFRYKEAQDYFFKMDKRNPQQALGLCLLAIKQRNIKSAEASLAVLDRNKIPDTPETRLYRAYCMVLRGGSQGSLIEARSLVHVFARQPDCLVLIAEMFMAADQYGQAADIAERVLQSCPRNDQALAVLANAAYAREDFSAAENHARDALKINRTNAYAKTVLMKLASRKGDYQLAEKLGRDIIAASPEYSLGRANLGDVYFAKGRYDLAKIEYQAAGELIMTKSKWSALRQARLLIMDEHYDAAVRILSGMVDTYHSCYDEACCDLAMCYAELKETEKEKAVLEKMHLRKAFHHRMQDVMKKLEGGKTT